MSKRPKYPHTKNYSAQYSLPFRHFPEQYIVHTVVAASMVAVRLQVPPSGPVVIQLIQYIR
jgi:hypothetical protein